MDFSGRSSNGFSALGDLSSMRDLRDIRDLGFDGHSVRDLRGISDLRDLRGLGMGNFDTLRDLRAFNGAHNLNGIGALGGGGGSIDLNALRGMDRMDAINTLRSLGVDLRGIGPEGMRDRDFLDVRDPRDPRNFDLRSPDLENPNLNSALGARMMYQQMMLHQQHHQQLIQRRERLAALQAAHAHGEPIPPHIHYSSHSAHPHNLLHRPSHSSTSRETRDSRDSSGSVSKDPSKDLDRHELKRRTSSSTDVGASGPSAGDGSGKEKDKDRTKDGDDMSDIVAFLDAVDNPSTSHVRGGPSVPRRSSSTNQTLDWPTSAIEKDAEFHLVHLQAHPHHLHPPSFLNSTSPPVYLLLTPLG
ncbi:hypothetical protein F5050DRAFT_1531060 [Lentinula boryana]|uniref:Uncharacterized protein n=1 Tax=Lentinula boryana TaxID=40481 RepID=A0ABQ8QEF3_9AGAR|nr:hypothetical protein F5050DRAFT_1531060 [Lentinula boryana]